VTPRDRDGAARFLGMRLVQLLRRFARVRDARFLGRFLFVQPDTPKVAWFRDLSWCQHGLNEMN
jgi:hypothetical protein